MAKYGREHVSRRSRLGTSRTFVTAHGLAPGDYVTELVANEASAAALFEP